MTRITSNRNVQVISIKHTVSAFFVYILMKSRVYMYCTYVTEIFFPLARDGRNAVDPARILISFRERGTVPFNGSLLRGSPLGSSRNSSFVTVCVGGSTS